MHILIGLLTLLGAIAVWYYRLKMIGGAARDIGRAAERVMNAPRKFAFMRRANQTGLKGVEDPREAASILMVLVGGGSKLSPEARQTIEAETIKKFDLDAEEADALVTHALWMVRDVEVPTGVTMRMAQVVIATPGIGPKELVDLDEMLIAVSEANGAADASALKLLQIYRDRAGLRA